MRENTTTRTKSSGNVFVDLGFNPEEAAVMLIRVEVLARLSQGVEKAGWPPAEVADNLGISQEQFSKIVKGEVDDLTLDSLLVMAGRAGVKFDLSFG